MSLLRLNQKHWILTVTAQSPYSNTLNASITLNTNGKTQRNRSHLSVISRTHSPKWITSNVIRRSYIYFIHSEETVN